ncbi:hypothetical protein JHK86_030776 [Glycine max]|nr:hypothetical protein JHK86_030776 [Glycine max]
MEVAAAKALKPSLRTEFIFPQAIYDEILCFNANNVVANEDFSMDDLLDFSNGEFQVGKDFDDYEEEEDEEKNSTSGSLQSQDRAEDDNNSNSTAGGGGHDYVFAGELSVPADDVADLEWVSHFVDDSLPELSILYPIHCSKKTRVWAEPESRLSPAQTVSKVPRKSRTEKPRKPNTRVWSSFTVFAGSVGFGELVTKKQKKKVEAQSGGAQSLRRCSHCQVQKTPQWRIGPLGPKTLCNACGVRFKSGRLFPEYRPACSPTFCGHIHSNNHRRVLEMRWKKQIAESVTGSDRKQLIPNY